MMDSRRFSLGRNFCGLTILASAVAEFRQVPKRIGEQKDFNHADAYGESYARHCLYHEVYCGEDYQEEEAVKPEAYLPSFAVVQAVENDDVQYTKD